MTFSPTAEQTEATDVFKTGKSLVVQAGAGTGKTTVIKQFGNVSPNRKGYYFAFNKGIVESAAKSLPPSIKAYTIHGYAFGRKGRFYSSRINSKFRMSNKQTAEFLGLADIELSEHTLSAPKLASMVMRGVQDFCKSADWSISGYHVPYVMGLSSEEMKYLRSELDATMKLAWSDIQSTSGKLNFTHSHYVKLWALDPKMSRINADYVVFDEAQDVMGCVIPILQRRANHGGQTILVGDEYQSINEWNGASNSMGQFPDFTRKILSQSFRFGQEIADIANLWLNAMGADMNLTGTGHSEIGDVEFPDAILCRTNAGTIGEALREIENGQSVALLGNTEEFISVADAALSLQAGNSPDHPLFAAFSTWPEVQMFAKSGDIEADEIKTWVNLIDSYSAQAIKDMTSELVSPENADVTVTTAHKTKGLEFASVRVGADFPSSDDRTHPVTKADQMLAYVTVTRAMQSLDPGMLASPEDSSVED